MIPDDLWELLTGERRRPVVVVEEPAERIPPEGARGEQEPEWLPADENAEDEEGLAPARMPAGEIRSLEGEEPTVVSLEEPPPPPEERHAVFRARIAASGAPEAANARAPRLPFGLSERTALQRAVILREILGPPKGLE